MIIGAMIAR